ncbi:hypothetical protein [Dokdonella sp.]|uniref:hypothetical protein n=2 Tax=Dokdonella sp. TaxID=2291710 RepID=UPI002BF5120B|nr:hypothetical protein [Dokdonella sp.]HOX70767.1 hypothetical protein [Dokdonella sp.]HPN80359.1 hypothetical protein [Dokdonella sp.]
MKMPIPLVSLLIALSVALVACQSNPTRSAAADPAASGQRIWFDGLYDNNEQAAQTGASGAPRVQFEITPLHLPGWYAWNVRLIGGAGVSATWAMQSFKSINGSLTMTPYRSITPDPAFGKAFDPEKWIALDGCALHGSAVADGLKVAASLASCSTLAPGIGTSAALLPLSIEHDGESLRVRLYADQARGPDARADARKVVWYSGWAAINGAGPNAKPEGTDWHMSRDLHIGNEGGVASLKWRDGQGSGYSLKLERATYRDGNVPVLKLSVIEDASRHAIAYAWANPEATRIGINLGWVQVGLDVAPALPAR